MISADKIQMKAPCRTRFSIRHFIVTVTERTLRQVDSLPAAALCRRKMRYEEIERGVSVQCY